MHRKLILASTSPYRRELLGRLGLPFDVANPQTDESSRPNEAPETLALRLSEAKARAVVTDFPDALIIGSDQVATVNGKIYGKPVTHELFLPLFACWMQRLVNLKCAASLPWLPFAS